MSLEQQLLQRLAVFNPSHLEVVNESAGHGGYFPGKESHFKVVMVSEDFQGLRAVQRHQKIYAAVGDLLAQVKFMHWRFMPLLHLNGRDKTPAVQNAPTHQKHRNGLK